VKLPIGTGLPFQMTHLLENLKTEAYREKLSGYLILKKIQRGGFIVPQN
jgi:hypothetical protein